MCAPLALLLCPGRRNPARANCTAATLQGENYLSRPTGDSILGETTQPLPRQLPDVVTGHGIASGKQYVRRRGSAMKKINKLEHRELE